MSFVCCERQDGSKYPHTCACPEVKVFSEIVSAKTATLCGFIENFGYESEPAIFYLEKEWTIPAYTSTGRTCYCDSVNKITSETTFSVRSGLTAFSDPSACSANTDPVPYTRTTVSYNYDVQCDPDSVTLDSTGTTTKDFVSYSAGFTIAVSARISEYTVPEVTGTVCGSSYVNTPSYVISEELVVGSEDTDTDALERAEVDLGASDPGYGSGSSKWETRGGRDDSFYAQKVKYCFVCTNLISGVAYEGSVPLQNRVTITTGYGPWAALSDLTFSFVATKVFEIVGGSLNPAISDQDFIDQAYSDNPLNYGLASGVGVIIPDSELDHVQGYEYVVGRDDVTNTKEPKVYKPA